MSPEKVINVSRFFDLKSLATREAARTLIQEISRFSDESVVLEFYGIVSVSRSFLDELNSLLVTSKKEIRLAHLNEDLAHLLKIVRKTAQRKDRVTYDSLSDAELVTL